MAFLLVFLHHSSINDNFGLTVFLNKMGWLGVELFFTLSGFLLCFLLLKEYEATGTINYRKFFMRRLLRIVPLYLVYLIAMLVMSILVLHYSVWDHILRLVGSLLFIDNIFTSVWGYNDAALRIAHLWTLSYEMQIYLIIPLLVSVIIRSEKVNRYRHIAWLIGIALTSILLRWVCLSSGMRGLFVWVLPFFRPESFIAGFCLAILLNYHRDLLVHIPGSIAFAISFSLFVLVYASSPDGDYWKWYGPYSSLSVYLIASVAFFALVVAALQEGYVKKFLELRPIVFLGRISYGLYVFHLLAIHVVVKVFPGPRLITGSTDNLLWFGELLAALTLTIVMATISYYLFELPILKRKSKYEIIKT